MKKFLSLALSLVMILSLVTISAGAAEYKDLTDKDEIQYEEAVAVLNRIGVITGYEDGSFKPTNELSRGAAAKIIVSLLIGPEAAENLGNTASPYPDVPAGNNFAGVISFCKNSGIINGYGDGTFRPTASLTGFAFAKMLLGALGYDVNIEGMVGDGWNMKVAALGQYAGLFDRLKFNGNDPVNREMACQMALNTLKGTMVEYNGGFTVSAGDAQVVGAQSRSFKVSNQEYAQNIKTRNATGTITQENFFTVEFAEEHFVDLRMTHDKWEITHNDFGRPSSEWDYRKVTIGTFPLVPDYSYTTQVAHENEATDASKIRALGLNGLKLADGTSIWVNGVEYELDETGTGKIVNAQLATDKILPDAATEITLGDIADLTDNGTIVEVYVSNKTADLITDIVVIKSQLMEIRRTTSDSVSLDLYDGNSGSDNKGKNVQGYNQVAMDQKIENVEVNDEYFEMLHGMKTGDLVVVIPLSTDGGKTYEVGGAYVPETVSGTITRATTYGKVDGQDPKAIDVTVGGTKYPISLWNAGDLVTVTAEVIEVSKKDVTLYLDTYGNAILAKDLGSQTGFMVVKGFYKTLVNNREVDMVEGWDVGGDLMSLNLGNNGRKASMAPGDLVYYTNDKTSSTADWRLEDATNRAAAKNTIQDVCTDDGYEIKSANAKIRGTVKFTGDSDDGRHSYYVANDIKFIYVTFSDDRSEVDSIEIVKGVQNTTLTELKTVNTVANSNSAEMYTKDGAVKVVVVKRESNNAVSSRLLYVRDFLGQEGTDSAGKKIYGYTVAMMTDTGLDEEVTIYSDKKLDRGDFASYALSSHTDEEFTPFYTLREHDQRNRTTSVNTATIMRIVNKANGWVFVGDYADYDTAVKQNTYTLGTGGSDANIIRIKDAKWLYLGPVGNSIRSCDDLEDWMYYDHDNDPKTPNIVNPNHGVQISFIYNDNKENDGFRNVALVVVKAINLDITGKTEGSNQTITAPTKVTLGGQNVDFEVNAETGVAGKAKVELAEMKSSEMALLKKGDLKFEIPSDASVKTITVKYGSAGGTVDVTGYADDAALIDATKAAAVPNNEDVEIIITVTPGKGDDAAYTIAIEKNDAARVAEKLPAGGENSLKTGSTESAPAGFKAKSVTADDEKIVTELEANTAGDTAANTMTKLVLNVAEAPAAAVASYAAPAPIEIALEFGAPDGNGVKTHDKNGVKVVFTPGEDAVVAGETVVGTEEQDVFKTYADATATLKDVFKAADVEAEIWISNTDATGAPSDEADGKKLTSTEIEAGPVDGNKYYTKTFEVDGTTFKAYVEITAFDKAFDSTKTYFKPATGTSLTTDDQKVEDKGAALTATELAAGPVDGTTYYTKTTEKKDVPVLATESKDATPATYVVTLNRSFLAGASMEGKILTGIKLAKEA